MERRRESAAPNLQAESYLEREHNARWAALGVAHATSGITANVQCIDITFAPQHSCARSKSQWLMSRSSKLLFQQVGLGRDQLYVVIQKDAAHSEK